MQSKSDVHLKNSYHILGKLVIGIRKMFALIMLLVPSLLSYEWF